MNLNYRSCRTSIPRKRRGKHTNTHIRTAWQEAFHTPPSTRLTIYRLRNKFDITGYVSNAPKSGRPKTSTTEENKTLVAVTFINSPKKIYKACFRSIVHLKNIIATLIAQHEIKTLPTAIGTWSFGGRPRWSTSILRNDA